MKNNHDRQAPSAPDSIGVLPPAVLARMWRIADL